ncbi:rhomboid family intramembrane serine protease [Polyangium spumosum]|uniref:Rhomboid family intramembrane serine protease n=1 Tax=Polyangium spumosum TaxID=889282 RepID=A0A6N7PPY2_9BACT|nr:rhomboid family intramembrane serine protease [Polyangium spumosum]MRG94262.1 rhomboid family intramembrane serine protease [Polyangium spumosum]
MRPEERIEDVELATDPSVVRRDRLLGAIFTEDPESCLIQHGPVASHVVTTSAPPQILLLPTRDRDALSHLPKLLAQIVPSAKQSPVPTHVVAVGGGVGIVDALRRAASQAKGAQIGFHHVDDASRLAHVSGSKLPLLERAAEQIRVTEPPAPERIQEALVKGRMLAQQDRRAASRLRGKTPVTIGLIAVCAVVGLLGLAWAKQMGGYTPAIVSIGATSGHAVRGGEVWRIFASAFLHGGVAHFVMNMVALGSLGVMLEPVLGSRRFLVLYGLSGLGGALATTLIGKTWSVGASGAIWGLMTAVLAIVLFPRGVLPPLFITRLKQNAWRPLVPNVLISFFPGVDYLAHFGGGVVGFVVTALVLGRGLKPLEERAGDSDAEPSPRPLLTIVAVVVGAAMLASIGAGIRLGGPWTMQKPPAMKRTALAGVGLSVEVPASVVKMAAAETENQGEMHVFTYGGLDATPVFVEIRAWPLERPVEPGELDVFLEGTRAMADEGGPAKSVQLEKARIVTAGERRAVVVEHELKIDGDPFVLRTYFLAVGARELMLRGYTRKDMRPVGWSDLEERIVASIEER